ncbi:MAG: methyltransferase domain-containing protein [Myxococcota bacterium]|nr:methyltransferase domain-containing protein [Myxococcota bacterium]
MQLRHFESFQPICPRCKKDRAQDHVLALQVYTGDKKWVEEGQLFCPSCRTVYPIICGIPILVPEPQEYIQKSLLHMVWNENLSPFSSQWLSEAAGPGSNFELTKQYLSTYCWCHYHDLHPDSEDTETSGLVEILQKMRQERLFDGLQIDIGCSVGRGTFDLAHTTQNLSLGVDVNFSMLRIAQKIQRTQRISYDLRKVGTIYKRQSYDLSLPSADLVDFWVADALNLPFANQSMLRCNSANVLDCVANPADHLRELSRIQNPLGYFSLVTPYDWSVNATAYDNWIGGHTAMGSFKGSAEKTVLWYLSSESPFPDLKDIEIIQQIPELSWRLRIHNRSTMHYKIHLIIARRTHGLPSPC